MTSNLTALLLNRLEDRRQKFFRAKFIAQHNVNELPQPILDAVVAVQRHKANAQLMLMLMLGIPNLPDPLT